MWAAGARFFSPPEQVVYHLWSREGRPIFSDNREGWDDDRRRSLALVRAQLGMHLGTATGSGSGSGSSAEATAPFDQSIGVDFGNQRVLPLGARGGLSKEEAARCFCDSGGDKSNDHTNHNHAPAAVKAAAASALPPNLLAKIMGMM